MAKKNKIIDIRKNDLHTIVRETIDRLLFEKMSINDEVLEATDYFVNKITQTYESKKNGMWGWQQLNIALMVTELPSLSFHLKNDYENERFSIIKNISCFFYNFNNVDELNYASQFLPSCSFLENGTLIITIKCLNKEIVDKSFRESLSHELNHVYQEFNKNFNTGKRYDLASKIVSKLGKYTETEQCLAWIFYYFSKREIDSRVYELYNQLKESEIKNISDINNLKLFQERQRFYDQVVFYFRCNMLYLNEKNEKAFNEFDTNPNKVNQYIMRMDKYQNDKIRRVVQRHFDELNEDIFMCRDIHAIFNGYCDKMEKKNTKLNEDNQK